MAAEGDENDLTVFSDAGFAGADTKSQNGLVITWAGSILTWRSSRAALSALSTAEAELCAAALGWQVTEGIRYLLSTLRIFPKKIEVMIDNKAALTAATLGSTWRTRYYAVRAKRLLEEHDLGRVRLSYCPTKEMVADALTKLATANVIQILLDAMDGRLPTRTITHRTSVSPGRANRSDEAGDGPKVGSNKYLTMQNIFVISIILPELVAISFYHYVYMSAVLYLAQQFLFICRLLSPPTMKV